MQTYKNTVQTQVSPKSELLKLDINVVKIHMSLANQSNMIKIYYFMMTILPKRRDDIFQKRKRWKN